MSVQLRHETLSGFASIVVENQRLRVVILPELGGRIWEVTDLARNRQWIWHRDDVPLARAHPGASYDDVWAGGWEELFPNDAAGDFEGRTLPDHGSWWTTAWEVVQARGGEEGEVHLACTTQSPKTSCRKVIRLQNDSDSVSVSYRIENADAEAFHFLFKQHLAVALSPSCTVALPGGHVTAVDTTFGTLVDLPGPFKWPHAKNAAGVDVDLRRVPAPAEQAREFLYVAELPEHWCGVDDLEHGASLRFTFDGARLPFVWLFLAYGGWRSCYTAVLEPCTNMPKDLAAALRAGQSARLPAGGVFETEVSLTVGDAPSAP